jgi:hypothetical protein
MAQTAVVQAHHGAYRVVTVQIREESNGQTNVRIPAGQIARFIGRVTDGKCDALQPLIGGEFPAMHHLARVAIVAHDDEVLATVFARQLADRLQFK